MNVQITKRILVPLFIALVGGTNIFASEEPIEIPIELKPVIKDTGTIKPKSSGCIKLSAYIDGDAVVVTSNVDIMAHVLIYDSASGQTYYNSTVALTPQCRCQIAPTDAVLTLQITVGDITYEGKIHISF